MTAEQKEIEWGLLDRLNAKYEKPNWGLIQYARLVDAVKLGSVSGLGRWRDPDCDDPIVTQEVLTDVLLSRLEILDQRMKMSSPCRCTGYSTCYLSWYLMERCARQHALEDEKRARCKPLYDEMDALQSAKFIEAVKKQSPNAQIKARIGELQKAIKEIHDEYLLAFLTQSS